MSGMFSAFGFGSNKPTKPPKAIPSSSIAKEDQSTEGAGTIKTKPGAVPAQTEIKSVAQRSVKISFPKGTKTARAIEDDIYRAASMFGTIMDIRIKGKNAVVLYSSVADADRCVSSWADTTLAAQDYRIKFMGADKSPTLNRSLESAASEESLDMLLLSNSASNVSLDKQTNNVSVLHHDTHTHTGSLHHDTHTHTGSRADIYTGGIAFDGSVVESNQTIQVLELEDVSNFDRTVNLSQASVSVSILNSNGRTSPAVSASPEQPPPGAPAVAVAAVAALEDSVDSHSYSPPKEAGGWRAAEKRVSPPPRPPRLSAGVGARGELDSSESGDAEGNGKKALTPKQVRVGRDVEPDASKCAVSINSTYISSANDTSNNQSEPVSIYNPNYNGDYNSTLLSNRPSPATKPAAPSSFSMSVSSGDGAGTFLTQAVPSTQAAAGAGQRGRVNSFGSDSGGSSSQGFQQPLFGNILDMPREATRPGGSGVLEGVLQMHAAIAPPARPQERDAAAEELLQRIRVLEAEARVAARERMDYEDEIRRTEEDWAIELTALGIRNKALEMENSSLREGSQRTKIELAKLASQVSALEARREAHAVIAGTSRSEADRDAYGTLLAQQKLVQVLGAHKEASEAQAAALKGELAALARAHQEAAAEGCEWKMRAARLEEELAALQAAGDSAGQPAGEGAGAAPSRVLAEASCRKVLNRELEKYLALERSLATPVLAHHAAANVWKCVAQETQFGAFFDIATESGAFASENMARQKPFLSSASAKYSNAIPQHWRSKE